MQTANDLEHTKPLIYKIKDSMAGVPFIDEDYSLGVYKEGVDYCQKALSICKTHGRSLADLR